MIISNEEEIRKDYDEFLEASAQSNKTHKKDLENSVYAGCYYCCTIFPANSIKEFVSSYRDGTEPDCALCPECGIDAVLPDSKVVLSLDFLGEMSYYWFGWDIDH
jgi:hypothetical protein